MTDAARIIARHLPLPECPDSVCLPVTITAGDLRTVYEALSAPPGEAVAWQRLHPTRGWRDMDAEDVEHYRAQGQEVRALYALAQPGSDGATDLSRMRVPRYDYTVEELLDEAVRRVVDGELEAPGGSVGTLGDLTAHGLILSMKDVILALANTPAIRGGFGSLPASPSVPGDTTADSAANREGAES